MQLLRSTPFLLAGSLMLAAPAAHAQTSFSIGPRVGLNMATYHLAETSQFGTPTYRAGVEVGVASTLGMGHVALQAAVLYSQKGFTQRGTVDVSTGNTSPVTAESTYNNRLHYLTIPLAVAYTQGHDGQGVQAFAGPYLGLLLGGTYETTLTDQYGGSFSTEGDITPVSNEAPDLDAYARRLDAGLHAGVGYRYHALLFQVDYSLGLRDVAARYTYNGVPVSNRAYYNRAFQGTLTYLFGKPN